MSKSLAATHQRWRPTKSIVPCSEHTINFYLRLGCEVSPEPDPELFELEPEDIHLEGEV